MTWQSNRARDFKKRTEGKLAAHWEEITQHLAPPVVAWSWGESGLSQEMKCYLRDKGLIERSPDGSKWRTSMDLWCYAIEKAADDEHVGADAQGQQLLLEDTVTAERATRYLGETTTRGRANRARQATLTGDIADRQVVRAQHEPDWTVVNARKGMHGEDNGREDAARHPGQSRLSTFEDYDRSNWDVTTPWFRSSAVTVPAGQVY
ncbi:hypothetical protein [Halorussus halobius]|uniref:hypothetical protein n=1 Tax=Halorussus halobius TaxID=1710537 RepID=UPI001092EEFE|nr:hypothetical protein [Halorussus halobius]